MSSKQRAYLKSLAQTTDPIFQIGKNGITPELTEAILLALEARELVKVSVLSNCLLDPKYISSVISERTHSIPVQVIGKKIIFYKPSKKNPKIILP
ncbi:YhbY family RNA-binding protein [Cellulosilyticum sp. I15G10I2]|uniref:YhbY family RNA-binding protein n=1 Tax=Cellulosilyticum sp. I15G10I2 TaxID=1892843 RepID=UPI00114D2263